MDDIMEVVDAVHRAEAYIRRSRRIVLLITLDVRNFFNSVKWTDMLGTSENSFHVASYLLRILRDYLKDRSLLYETLERQMIMEITSGVAQGSILGSDLWNAFYDSLLRIDMLEESRLVGYADDVAALVAGRTVEHAQSLALEKNRSGHLDQKENPDPASHINRPVDCRVKTSC